MSRTQRRKGLSVASLRLKTLNDKPYLLGVTRSMFSKINPYKLLFLTNKKASCFENNSAFNNMA